MGTESTPASWNPAFRPDHDEVDVAPHAPTTVIEEDNLGAHRQSFTRSANDFFDSSQSQDLDTAPQAQEFDSTIEQHDQKPETNYEHQGGASFLQDAVAEDALEPLVGAPSEEASLTERHDGASEPTFDWGTSEEPFDLSLSSEAPDHPQSAEDTGKGQDIDWGQSDTATFDIGVAVKQAGEEHPAAEQGSQEDLDALWKAALDDDEFLPEEPAADASAFIFDDGEGFLDDLAAPEASLEPALAQQSGASRYAPGQAQQSTPPANPYAPQSDQFADFSQLTSTPAAAPSYLAYTQPTTSSAQQRPATLNSAQSFADKSKGGYHSPFDLPEDLAKPRKKPVTHHSAPVNVAPPFAPPRSSSTTSPNTLHAPPSIQPVQAPPSLNHATASSQSQTSASASADFFAELPVVSKPRPSGRYTPQPVSTTTPLQAPPKRSDSWSSSQKPESDQPPLLAAGLQQPDRLPPFPDLTESSVQQTQPPPPRSASRYSPAPSSTIQVPPSGSSRYSPAPSSNGLQAAPPASARYSPAPPVSAQLPPPASGPQTAPPQNKYSPQPPLGASVQNKYPSEPFAPPRPPFAQFLPRTSSPLAHTTSLQDDLQYGQQARSQSGEHTAAISQHRNHASGGSSPLHYRASLEDVREAEEPQQALASLEGSDQTVSGIPKSVTPPLSRSGPSSMVGSPRKRVTSNYIPQTHIAPDGGFSPPRRSQSQSPGATMKVSKRISSAPLDRPASVHDAISPTAGLVGVPNTQVLPHRRGFSRELDFIVPTDERAIDSLERWKGYPVFNWGLGGTIVTSFPKYIPRYGTGQLTPMVKCSPGETKLHSVKETYPLPDFIAKFPGPLKGKGKKKDLLTWLKTRVEALEREGPSQGYDEVNLGKYHSEKVLLWKVLLLLVEHDGRLEGTAPIEQAVHEALSSGSTNDYSAPVSLPSEPVESATVSEIQKLLSGGDREKAVWYAVDHRLWGHALLLSSTLSRDTWKRVVQEFVQKEVKAAGGNTRALAALYEVFAGNWEESIDELVPASARAGFQMISTSGHSTANALEGIEQWRETLLLILRNRTDGDLQALLSLGRLLAEYRRVEAAHVCFLFARSIAYLGGADDPQSDLVLVGADHKGFPHGLGHDLESIILTEVFEYAISLAPSGAPAIPHLQAYKLAHAYTLAEHGLRNDALQYCDAIAASMKATTRGSAYYHVAFTMQLDDLSKRLSQSPKDPSSSWISKPSMEKVSGSLLAKFNSFVAGDESDAASNHSGAGGDVGPFARIAGNTPNDLSPSHSNIDLYGSYQGSNSMMSAAAPSINSRYAPTNAYAPRSASGDFSHKSRYDPSSQYQTSRTSMDSVSAPFRRESDSGFQGSPQPLYGQQPQSPPATADGASKSQTPYSSYMPDPVLSQPQEPTSSFQQPSAAANVIPQIQSAPEQSYGYEPPSMGYEPPSYQPYEPEPEPESAETQPGQSKKKKSFMDDDDDDDDEIARRAAELKKQQKSQADKEAEENFRRAAEADAARSKQNSGGEKKGWFGGWFGGKKDANAPTVYKAKLGEESSFVYDPELKRWVNKKAGADSDVSTPAAATPPPPRSGPPQPSSAPPTRPPTSNPIRSASMPIPHRSETPSSVAEGSTPPTLMPPTLMPPGGNLSKPPSRPGTAMSNASSIDDLLGAPQARKGAGKKAKRGGRYVDVMGAK